MTIDQLYTMLVAALPTITAVGGIIVACVKMFKKFGELKAEITNTADYKELLAKYEQLSKDHAEIVKEHKELDYYVQTYIKHMYTKKPEGVEDGKNSK